MVGSFSFSIRLPFPMVSFFGYWGAFSFPSGFDGWLFRFRPRLLRSGSSFASFRLNGGLRDSLFVLRSGWSSVFPLSCSRFVFSSRSFALRFSVTSFPFPLFPMVSVFPRFPLRLFPSFVFVFSFSSFCSWLHFFLFCFSSIRPALLFSSFVVFGFFFPPRFCFRITPS